MNILLWTEDSEAELRAELQGALPGIDVRKLKQGLLQAEFRIQAEQAAPHLAFCRQLLPEAVAVQAESIGAWTEIIYRLVADSLPGGSPWLLHVAPQYAERAAHRIGARAWHSLRRQDLGQANHGHESGSRPSASPDAGRNRCGLIHDSVVSLLQKRRRSLLRTLALHPQPFTKVHSLVQVLLTEPAAGFIAIAPAPLPFAQRHLVSPFPKGEVPISGDKSAPSRAFSKLLEAELRLGLSIAPGETCVDLGAAPGSWTYVAAQRGARVTAVDRSPLRPDLMADASVQFRAGDAFGFEPARQVDWLLCDVIAAPEKSAELLLHWLKNKWCRRFVVTLKTMEGAALPVLTLLKNKLPAVANPFFLNRLGANKKEVCVFGSALP